MRRLRRGDGRTPPTREAPANRPTLLRGSAFNGWTRWVTMAGESLPGGDGSDRSLRMPARKHGTGDLGRTPQRSAESRLVPDRKGAGTRALAKLVSGAGRAHGGLARPQRFSALRPSLFRAK